MISLRKLARLGVLAVAIAAMSPTALDKLPLSQADLTEFRFIPLGPLRALLPEPSSDSQIP